MSKEATLKVINNAGKPWNQCVVKIREKFYETNNKGEFSLAEWVESKIQILVNGILINIDGRTDIKIIKGTEIVVTHVGREMRAILAIDSDNNRPPLSLGHQAA